PFFAAFGLFVSLIGFAIHGRKPKRGHAQADGEHRKDDHGDLQAGVFALGHCPCVLFYGCVRSAALAGWANHLCVQKLSAVAVVRAAVSWSENLAPEAMWEAYDSSADGNPAP